MNDIRIPPLRERLDDLGLLVNGIIDRLNPQLGTSVEGVGDEVMERFAGYDWRGNIRELQNVMERGMNAKPAGILGWEHFEDYFSNQDLLPPSQPESDVSPKRSSIRLVKKQAKKALITDTQLSRLRDRDCGSDDR